MAIIIQIEQVGIYRSKSQKMVLRWKPKGGKDFRQLEELLNLREIFSSGFFGNEKYRTWTQLLKTETFYSYLIMT